MKARVVIEAESAKDFLKRKGTGYPRCRKCGSNLQKSYSVHRAYFSKHGEPDVVVPGHYEPSDGYFEPDTPVTGTLEGFDLADDSDSCANCGLKA